MEGCTITFNLIGDAYISVEFSFILARLCYYVGIISVPATECRDGCLHT